MKKLCFAAAAAACFLAPGLALAGEPGVSGQIQVAASGNDNIFASNGGEVSDTVYELSGGVTLKGESEAGFIKAFGTFDLEHYNDVDDENAEDFSLGLKAGTNFAGGKLTAGASHALNTEARTDRMARRDTRERTEFTVDSADVGFSVGLGGSVELSGSADISAFDYEDGVTRIGGFAVDQDRRDRTVTSQSLRLDWSMQDGVGMFVAVGHGDTDYDLRPPASPHNRDSSGVSVTAGLSFEIDSTLSGEIGAGWSGRSFDQAGFDDASTFVVDADLTWTPDKETTVTFAASRSFEETTVLGSPIYVATAVGVTLNRSLTERLDLSLSLSHEWDDHEQVDREDTATTFDIGLTAGLTEHVAAGVSYSYASEDSDGLFASPGYDVGVVSGFLKLTF